MSDLKSAKRIVLHRVENGWIANEGEMFSKTLEGMPLHVFASTASLCRALPALIGESGWEVKPERDAKGHFVKKYAIPSVIFRMTHPPRFTDQLVSTTYPVQSADDSRPPDAVILGEPSPENPYDFQGAELPARAGQSAQQQDQTRTV